MEVNSIQSLLDSGKYNSTMYTRIYQLYVTVKTKKWFKS